MENKNFINQSLWAGSSPNQTGETQSRENRIGVFSYFYRTFVLLFTLLTMGVGNVWGGEGWVDNDTDHGIYLSYTKNNVGYAQDRDFDNPHDFGTLTSDLVFNKIYFKVWWENWAPQVSAQFVYSRDGGSTQYPTSCNYIVHKGGNNREVQYNSDAVWNFTVAKTTEASGSHYIDYEWKVYMSSVTLTRGLKRFTYSIAPPAVSGFGVTTSGYIAGSGTEADPYLVKSGESLTFTVAGSQAHTDANSTFNYWLNSGPKQTSGTLSTGSVTSTSLQSAVVHGQYINNSLSDLVGTESNTTIYYKAVEVKEITPVAKYTDNGSDYTESTTGGTVTINGNSSATQVIKDATYEIVATPASGYCVEEIKVGDAVAWSQPIDYTRQTAAKTISTYRATATTTVSVKFAKLRNITVYIDNSAGVPGLEIQNCTPKVGGYPVSDNGKQLTEASNGWYYHTFTNVTHVDLLNIACANEPPAASINGGQVVVNYTLTEDTYFSVLNLTNTAHSSICDVMSVSYSDQDYVIGAPAITLSPTYQLGQSAPTYTWSVTSQPDGGSYILSSTSEAKPTFSASVAGTYTLQVQLSSDGCVKSTTFNVVVESNDPELTAASFVKNPIFSTDKLQVSISYRRVPAEGCYVRLKTQGGGYWDDDTYEAWTPVEQGSGTFIFTTKNTNVPTGKWVVELYNSNKSPLGSREVDGTLTVETAHNITIAAGANGSVSPTVVHAASGVPSENFTATPDKGYEFVEWTKTAGDFTLADAKSATTYVTTATSSGTATATFQGISHTLTLKTDGNGTIEGKSSARTGESVTVTTKPSDGFIFDHITVNGVPQAAGVTTFTMPNEDVTVVAYFRHAPALSAVTASPSGPQNYTGSPITFNLSVTSTYLAEPVVIFYVEKAGDTTYEVVGAPYGPTGEGAVGTIGSDAANTTVHKATFSFSEAGSYTVSAKLYEGKLIDNFEPAIKYWSDIEGGKFDVNAENPSWQGANGSNHALRIELPSADRWRTAITRTEAGGKDATSWNESYAYIHVNMYASVEQSSTIIKYSDKGGEQLATNSSELTSKTWVRRAHPVLTATKVDFIFPFIVSASVGDVLYIDDIILSNEATMTAKASQASTASFSIRDTYTITYKDQGGASFSGSHVDTPSEHPTTHTYGTATNLNTATKEGFTFGGWYTNAECTGKDVTSLGETAYSDDITLYAKWTENLTSVTLAASPSGRGSFTIDDSPATSTSAGVATKPTVTAVPITGYFLTGTIWSADNSNISLSATNTAYTTITGCGTASTSSTLTATFTEKYLLCGSVNADGDPAGGMRGWAISGDNNAYSSVTYDDNTITIVANLTNAGTQYKCKIRDVQNSAWKGQTGSSSMSSGDQWKWDGTNDVYFTTTVAGSYTFTIDISGSSPLVRITYPGEPEYSATLSVHSSGHGSVSPSAGSITLRPVTTTTITATPEPGYRFKQWTVSGVSCSSTTSATATFTASAAGGTIEAEFTNEGIIYLDKSAISSKWSGTPYVYFYSGEYWNNVSGSGSQTSPSEGVPGTCISASNAMKRIGESQIWYYDYSALLSAGTSKQYIAFVDKSNQTGKNWFDACSVIYRGDFYPGASMFVVRDYTVYKNQHDNVQTAYYNEGYWRKYNDTDPGYVLKIYNGTGGGSTKIGYAKFASEEPGNNTCTAKINLSSGLKGFKVEGCDTTTINGVSYAGTWYSNSGSMTSTNCSNWEFTTGVSANCGITPTAGGDYIFTLSLADGRLYVSVEYPLANNDYRIVYNGKVKTTGDATHHPSNFIRNTSNGGVGKDTVSFFVTDDGEGDPDWSLTLQKCTNASANPVQWANACDAGHTLTASDLDLSGKTGVYVFEIEQNSSGSCSDVTIRNLGEYEGNYYIRTDVADGGWEAYETVPDNKMIFSEYARDHSGFDYYHCHWTPTNTNVKFTIANDYSACITDTVENDTYVTEYGKLPYQASVRFMYNSATNSIGRAYLNGSSEEGVNTFLWLEGAAANGSEPEIFTESGSALTNNIIKMQDKNNWIYQIDIQANEQARVKLISNYRFNSTDHLQYFKGTDGDWSKETTSEIIGGDYSSYPNERHALRIIYDFKTNHLLSAWLVPESGPVPAAAINTNVMIIKQNQEDARQIIFPSGNALTEVDTVYTAVLLTKEFLTGGGASEYAKQFYWVSFPYTVKINDIFGSVGTYGYDWILQRYNGKKRAANGFWIDSEPNWEFMDRSETLNPYEGYILTLDLGEFTSGSLKWNNNVTYLSLYFPSDGVVGNIKQTNVSVKYTDQSDYVCTITRDNRNIKDSYWHCIGSPSFAENTIGGWNWHENTDDTWKTGNLPFLYEWNSETNQLSPVAAGGYTFKPLTGYMVQYSGASIEWANVVTPSAQAPRRQNSAATDLTYKLQLVRGEEEVDHTFVRFSDDENITAAFEFNQDLCKEFKSGANIYTITSDAIQVAGNSLPLSTTQTTVVPVGVKIKTAGDYTFSIPEGTDGIGVTLVDNETGVRTLLSALDYTVNLTAGTHDGRFILEISPIQNTPTDIENVQGDNVQCTKVRKVMIDGILYIVKDGKIFDARGARVE